MSAARRESISAWLFMLPGLIPLVAFLYWPLGQAFGLSFFQWNLLGDPKFVGTLQYERLIASETFHQSLMVTLVYTVGVSITAYALSLGSAVMLNKAIRGVKAVRTVSLLPAIIPMVVAGVIWKFIYEPTGGPLNQMLAVFGIEGPAWLQDPALALPSVMLVSVWKDFGIYMLVLLGGLQQIPRDIEEAAWIDGATPTQTFWRVKFPMLGAVNLFVLVLLIFNSFKVFDQVWVMTEGGPGNATLTIITFLYTRMQVDIGFAAAGTTVLFLLVLIPLTLQVIARRKVKS
ncbi:sugar ABC transporter permease [Microbacterium sp. CFH 90308]|uniref:Sugar ABC transporter permease n=1 Tax=Microbacterium salsuginis TaxID=2722803 RepID=A0ABX1K8D8_9MICO|nr:sugar ABC transporter permease [Microbacterium sp. CFH 90308]NLP83262.1 sugar ABC transporter permease [Microbacterium sp. CFH 90308]